MIIPELLAPAGNMEALKAALHFGADAVYGGMKSYGLRAFAGNFDPEALREAAALVHAAGAKFYVTMNIFPYDDQLDGFVAAAKEALAAGVDAAIVSDTGAILTLREKVPELPIHVSTQANTVNAPTVRFWASQGCERVILAREMSLDRIRRLRESVPEDIELETFVHGASCMAYSGRCMLSAELTGRSANQGACAQPCRWQYAVVEAKRPGEYLPVSEDEHGTYIFSARDLRLLPWVPQLAEAGVASLKIEGRMKTAYYVATAVAAYRRGLDLLRQGEAAFRAEEPLLDRELNCCSHRLSDSGFLLGKPEAPAGAEGNWQEREFIAQVEVGAEAGCEAVLSLRNRFHAGDTLELLTPQGVTAFTAESFVREKTGERLDTFGIAGELIRLRLPVKSAAGDILRGPVRNHRKA